MVGADISDGEFDALRRFFESASGIRLADTKKVLVCGRLSKRLRHHGLASYRDYLSLLRDPQQAAERQIAVDLLTTNETHFFREPKHFDVLRDLLAQRIAQGKATGFRAWSAASSTGEEAWSVAMTLAEVLGDRPWHIFASDLSTRVLEEARRAVYGAQRAAEIPPALARKYLLEGFDEYEGLYRIDAWLRERVRFEQVNLMENLPSMEAFDVIFLRNVLIYFDNAGKRRIVEAVARRLKPDGLLFIGHSETLGGITDVLRPVMPTVYRP
jgi:chemotaxis protein methyltransferase CheR